MKKILMILTSHRLDCLRLCVDMLAEGGSGARFDRVCMLCSGVTGRHKRYVESLPERFPNIAWDFIWGERGRGKPISDMQNACVQRYPDSLYFKIDEDTFVSADWDLKLIEAHERFKEDPQLSLITPVVTNNQRGAYHLLTTFPELGEEFVRRFNKPIVTDRMGPVWLIPHCAEFMIRRFLHLEQANEEIRKRLETTDRSLETGDSRPQTQNQEPKTKSAAKPPPFLTFSYPFSINCICYDYRHWQEIGGVPEEDENGWGQWIPANGKIIVLVADALVHHYAFFVQQRWLDRTSLLEDIRAGNVPGSRHPRIPLARLGRTISQVPEVLRERLHRKPA